MNNKVNNKLYGNTEKKVDLSSQKVELGLVDEYNKRLLSSDSDKYVNAARANIKDAVDNFEKASAYFDQIAKDGDDIIKKANELGVEVRGVKNNQKMAQGLAKDFLRDANTVRKLIP